MPFTCEMYFCRIKFHNTSWNVISTTLKKLWGTWEGVNNCTAILSNDHKNDLSMLCNVQKMLSNALLCNVHGNYFHSANCTPKKLHLPPTFGIIKELEGPCISRPPKKQQNDDILLRVLRHCAKFYNHVKLEYLENTKEIDGNNKFLILSACATRF